MSRLERISAVVGAGGLLVAVLAGVVWPDRFFHAWLAALTAWLGWPLGSMALLLVHALTGGRWGHAIRPALLAGIATLPLLLPALVPLLPGLRVLYPWLSPGVALDNAFYLNGPFFAARGIVYLVVWFALAAVARRAMARGPAALAAIAPVGLMALALTFTFAAIDTTMSLDPQFNSSIYGLIAMAGAGLLALSVAVLLSASGSDVADRADLGRLLLGLVVLWAYLDFMQLLIVWEADLAPEAAWYAIRSRGGWIAVIAAIGLLHLLLPFALLLSPALKRSATAIAAIAALLVAMEILRDWWLVLPAGGHGIDPIAASAVIAVGGFAACLGARSVRRAVP